jgi:aryl carrier-like protein
MTPNSDTNTAIELLETLLKAKIRLQDAQAEAEPMLETVGLLFEPEALNDDQKNLLRNGLKSLRKLLEAHTSYGEAVQQAEPARAIVNQLLGSQPSAPKSANGKTAPPAESDSSLAESDSPPAESDSPPAESAKKSAASTKGSGSNPAKAAK